MDWGRFWLGLQPRRCWHSRQNETEASDHQDRRRCGLAKLQDSAIPHLKDVPPIAHVTHACQVLKNVTCEAVLIVDFGHQRRVDVDLGAGDELTDGGDDISHLSRNTLVARGYRLVVDPPL